MNRKKIIHMKPMGRNIILGLSLLISTLCMAQNNNQIFTAEVIKENGTVSITIYTNDNNAPYYYVLRDKQAIEGSKVIAYSKKTRANTYTFKNLENDSYCVCVSNNNAVTVCETIRISDNPQSQKE